MTDGGRRDAIQRSVFEHIKSNFKFMVAVGVGTEVEDEELRKLSTRGRSLHIQNFDGKYLSSTPNRFKPIFLFVCLFRNDLNGIVLLRSFISE